MPIYAVYCEPNNIVDDFSSYLAERKKQIQMDKPYHITSAFSGR